MGRGGGCEVGQTWLHQVRVKAASTRAKDGKGGEPMDRCVLVVRAAPVNAARVVF